MATRGITMIPSLDTSQIIITQTNGNIERITNLQKYQKMERIPEQVIFYAPPASSSSSLLFKTLKTQSEIMTDKENFNEIPYSAASTQSSKFLPLTPLTTSSVMTTFQQAIIQKPSQTQQQQQLISNNQAIAQTQQFSSHQQQLFSSPAPKTAFQSNFIYRERSLEETEAAHDLLSLSQSLPPLPAPCVVTILQQDDENEASTLIITNNTQKNSSNIQEMNSNEISKSSILNKEQCHIFNTIQERSSIIIAKDDHHVTVEKQFQQPFGINAENCSPLTPPSSEHSSDVEIEMTSSESSMFSIRTNYSNTSSYPQTKDDDLWSIESLKSNTTNSETTEITDGRKKSQKKFGKSANNKSSSQNSQSKKSTGGGYKCLQCGKQYATSSNLSRHKQTHRSLDSQSAKKCNTCGKAYVSMPALAMHLLTHKLTHSCGICGKLFSRPWLLQGHLRSHTGEKPYSCANCKKAFADRSNLRAHMQTHSTEKSFECSKCHKTFALKSYLNKHLESSCLREKEINRNTDSVSGDDENDEDIIVT